MNKVILMGRITKDIEIKQTGEHSYTRFTIAVNRRKKDDGADFINCVAWNKSAEFVKKYFGKGSMIAVVGELRTGSYEKSDGSKAYTTEVVVSETFFTGEKKGESKPADEFADFTPAAADEEFPWG